VEEKEEVEDQAEEEEGQEGKQQEVLDEEVLAGLNLWITKLIEAQGGPVNR